MNWVERLNHSPGCIRLGELGQARILHWAYSPALPDNVPHRHAYYEVCLVGASGAGDYWVQGASHRLTTGTLFFARPGIVHQIRSQPDAALEVYWVSFQLEAAARQTAFAGFAQSTLWTCPDTGDGLGTLWRCLKTLVQESVRSPLAQAQQDALVSVLLLKIIEMGSPPAQPSAIVTGENVPPQTQLARAAVRYIHDHLSQTFSVTQVAAHVGVSPRHLTRLVTELTGLAPAAYIATARLDQARFLLLRTDDPLKQIAVQVGYRDVHHFTRAFARCFGCPPGQFRASGGGTSRRRLSAGEENIGALV